MLSAEYLEVAAMAMEPAFDVNTSRCSDGNPPIFFAVSVERLLSDRRREEKLRTFFE